MCESSANAIKMLATALEMEEKGKKYYDEAVETCRNQLGRDVFRLLADYEIQHMKRIREIHDSIRGGGSWSAAADFEPVHGLAEVFRKLAREQKEHIRADTGDLEAIDIGVKFESASVKFYQEYLGHATNPLEKRFLEHMVEEERGHLNLLTDMRQYYTDPESWFLEKDRAGLDGA